MALLDFYIYIYFLEDGFILDEIPYIGRAYKLSVLKDCCYHVVSDAGEVTYHLPTPQFCRHLDG